MTTVKQLTSKDLRAMVNAGNAQLKVYGKDVFDGRIEYLKSLPKTRSHRILTKEVMYRRHVHSYTKALISAIKDSVTQQENPANRIISSCKIVPERYLHVVYVTSDVDGWAEEEKELFSFYPDEMSFSPYEFLGISEKDAINLFHKKNMAYLRS